MKFYLAGGMEGLSWKEQTKWRRKIKNNLEAYSDGKLTATVCDPTEYYNFKDPSHISLREPMNYDLWRVKHSDVVIVNFTHKPVSLGTMAEMTTAYNFNIPIIGLAEQGVQDLHDWQKCMPLRIFTDMDEMLAYIKDFYLN